MTPHTAPDVMDKEQCAAYLGVGTTTVERWRDTEGLPYIKIGAIARYRRAAIDAWLAARETTNHPTPTPPARTTPTQEPRMNTAEDQPVSVVGQCEVVEYGKRCARKGNEFAGGEGPSAWICDIHLGRIPRPPVVCYACGATMDQCKDSIRIRFIGGYGMFIDTFDLDPETVELCERCAAEMCEKLPWVAKLLEEFR